MAELRIGRNRDCDIVIPDPTVSKAHATLIINGNAYSIRDENSSNGTFVNGSRIRGTYMLNENDIVKVGNTVVPWKNYLKRNTAQNSSGGFIDQIKNWFRNRKMPFGGAFAVGGFVVVILLVFIAYFFRGAERDEVKIATSWENKDRSAYLQRLIFERPADKKGTYMFSLSDRPGVFQGFYTINTSSKILVLSRGMEVNSANYQDNTQYSVSFEYKFQKEELLLTQLNTAGTPMGQPSTFLKSR
jgi:hypothetical protein